jgi:hypothetical protein
VTLAKETRVTTNEEAAMSLPARRTDLPSCGSPPTRPARPSMSRRCRLYKAAFRCLDADGQGYRSSPRRRSSSALLGFREDERKRVAREAACGGSRPASRRRNATHARRIVRLRVVNPSPSPSSPRRQPPAAAPAPAPVVPTYGTRRLKEELKTFVTITDPVKDATHFAQAPELMAILQTLAERAVKRGESVPGITTREGLV